MNLELYFVIFHQQEQKDTLTVGVEHFYSIKNLNNIVLILHIIRIYKQVGLSMKDQNNATWIIGRVKCFIPSEYIRFLYFSFQRSSNYHKLTNRNRNIKSILLK